MSDILVWKEKLQKVYAYYSLYIDKAIQLVLALLTFFFISQNMGLNKAAASPFISIVLAVICTFLPPVCTVIAAGGLMLLHMFSLSMGIMAVAALIFLIMFIFYCRFTPQKALIILVTVVAFLAHIPYVIPVVCGLAFSPIAVLPAIFGAVIYYMIECVKTSGAAIGSAEGVMTQISLFVKAVFQNKELWITCLAFIICVFAVYFLHRLAVENAWKVAVVAGAVVNVVVIAVGDIAFNVHTSYVMLIVGNILAVIAGLLVELFIFSVDYSRTEHLQFEDDDYYYYVKAVPKVSMTEPVKTVKKINERREPDEEEESVAVYRREPKRSGSRRNQGKRPVRGGAHEALPAEKRERKPAADSREIQNTDELLLAKKLQEELDIQEIVQKELENDTY